MFSRINIDGRDNLRDIVTRMNGSIVDDVRRCTVLVMDTYTRTCKSLCAMAKGIPIVSSAWMHKIRLNDYRFIDTESYILRDKASEKRFKYDMRKTLAAARATPLLRNYIVYVTGSVMPPPKEICDIVNCAGGRCILSDADEPTAVERLNAKFFMISASEDRAVWPRFKKSHRRAPIVGTEGFMLSIMRHHIDFAGYIFKS